MNPKYDWQKFEMYYRVWGRKLYDPEASVEAWRRWMRGGFGAAATQVETAVANASRILPLLTSAHLPSASNHSFWAELYTNMPIATGGESSPYNDTPEPRRFGTVSPLDPQTFSSIEEYAADLLAGSVSAKYSPIEVAQWMEDCAAAASDAQEAARRRTAVRTSAAFRRMEADVLIQVGLGRFFAAKLRSGVLLEIFEQSGDRLAGLSALDQYKLAREAWATMATQAARVYQSDIAYGSIAMRRGHWSDRLAAIDRDIQTVESQVKAAPATTWPSPNTTRAVQAATGRPVRPTIESVHTPPAGFAPGAPLALSITAPQQTIEPAVASVVLYYRHVNQGERWLLAPTQENEGVFSAIIPAEYTQSPYALEYRFELRTKSGMAWFNPAFNATLGNQPYCAVMSRIA
jgi:hypothetical protein